MIIRRTSFCIFLLTLINCSTFQFSKHDGLWEYVKGKPGTYNSMKVNDGASDGYLVGERHPYYLWFRTPEIIFNPQGGLHYPDAYVKDARGVKDKSGKVYNTAELDQLKDEDLKLILLGQKNFNFNRTDAGILDYLLVYRELLDESGGEEEKSSHIAASCLYVGISPIFLAFHIPFRLIVYPIHDVIKTIMLPVAAIYYSTQPSEEDGNE